MAPTDSYLYVLVAVCLAGFSGQGFAQSASETASGKFACGRAATWISAVQGNGPGSPLAGSVVDVEAVVVGVFQKPGELGGLFVQEEDPDQDQDTRTSEGLFALTHFPARTGDRVRIRGTVKEFEGLTELHPVTRLQVCSHASRLPTPVDVILPAVSADGFEAIENMRVKLPQTLVITDLHQLWQFGELAVSSARLVQPSQVLTPGETAKELAHFNGQDRLIIDDGRAGRYLPVSLKGQDNATLFSADNPVRTGQVISGLGGIMHYGFGHYRLQPTQPLIIEGAQNFRTSAPDPVGGTLRASAFNVLSYFSTLDGSGPVCGPSGNQPCRGAHSLLEQGRQMQKLAAALTTIDADIFALVELENNSERSLQDVVHALNSAKGDETWSYVESGSIGQDAIKTGLLFKPAVVAPAGNFAILDHDVDARFNDALNRPALAQSFRIHGSGMLLTVIVVHLKSKSCSGGSGLNVNQYDGQACFNQTRTEAAAALADWAMSDPTGTGGEQVLVLGDFNSYRMENPIQMMQQKSLVNLLPRFAGTNAYTYVYDGLIGTLDYAFSNSALAVRVTGATAWHINADESSALDYKDESGKPKAYYAANPFRSSDHDPLIIGLDMGSAQAASDNLPAEEDSSTLRYTLVAGVLLLLLLGTHVLRKERLDIMSAPNPSL